MMDKSDIGKMEGRVEKSKLVGVSMLVLSLLLTASVASLIFVAVSNGNSGCQTVNQETSDVDVTASVNIKSKEVEMKERIEYSSGNKMVYMYGSNGQFDFDDLRKGFHLTRSNENGVCYLIPTGGNHTLDEHIEEFLKEWDGKELEVESEDVEAHIYEGKLSDVSFLPQKVQDECTSGYQWIAVIAKEHVATEEAEHGGHRHQRSTSYCHWHCYAVPCSQGSGWCIHCINHCHF